jgi:glycerol-3-phosphate O-acyltransferase
VAVNYDRVLEDRSLLRELEGREKGTRPSRAVQAYEVSRYVGWNVGRLFTRRWKRYGRAAVVVGAPVALAPWFGAHRELFGLERPARLAQVQELCDELLVRVGQLIPVTPVPLVCAALQTFDSDFVSRAALLERIGDMRRTVQELNGRVLTSDMSSEAIFDRAYRMLRMRRVIARDGSGYILLPRGRPLVSYYANSVAHLLGPFMDAVRARDVLPLEAALRTEGTISKQVT